MRLRSAGQPLEISSDFLSTAEYRPVYMILQDWCESHRGVLSILNMFNNMKPTAAPITSFRTFPNKIQPRKCEVKKSAFVSQVQDTVNCLVASSGIYLAVLKEVLLTVKCPE